MQRLSFVQVGQTPTFDLGAVVGERAGELFLAIDEPYQLALLGFLILLLVIGTNRYFNVEAPLQALLGCLFGLLIVSFVAPWLVVAGAMALGLTSIYVSKSGRHILVAEWGFFGALFASAFWAIALTIAHVIASGILMVVLALEVRDARDLVEGHIAQQGRWAAYATDGNPNPQFFYDWIAGDSILFAFQIGLVLFVANRIRLLRVGRSGAWLAIVPPAIASATAFVIDHVGTITRFLSTLEAIEFKRLMSAVVAEFVAPFEAIIRTIAEPERFYAGAITLLVDSEASFFELATYFPWLFFVIAIAFAARHLLFGGGEVGDGAAA